MSSRWQYTALVAVIICLAGLLLAKQGGQDRLRPPRLPEIDRQAITKIKLSTAQKAIELVRKDESWKILPGKFWADRNRIEELLDALAGVELTALVSESGNFDRYQLGEQDRIRVEAFAGKRLVRAMDIGRTAPTGRHTFVRLEGDKRVFHARGLLQPLFRPDPDHLRDKAILAFNPDQVTGLDIQIDKRKLEIKPGPNQEGQNTESKTRTWLDQDGNRIDSSRIERLLNLLAKTRCTNFTPDFPKDRTKLAIRIDLAQGSSQELALAAPQKDSGPYPARSSFQATPFTIDTNQGRMLVKAAESLFPGSD